MKRKTNTAFDHKNFSQRLNSMLRVDFRRMFSSSMLWIMLGCALVIPILILVMATGFTGTTVADPNTGIETTMEAFTNTWQIIASDSGSMNMMDMTAMMNINLMYFLAGIFMCLFVGEDFRSGYAKNLFTVRSLKGDYVASKTIAGFVAGALMLIAFFIGALLGGSFAGLSFDLGTAGVFGVVMCMLAKISLMLVFVAIFLLMSVFAKQRTWLSILLALFGGMLLFMMIPMMTPLNSGIGNLFMCLVGGAIFAVGIGQGSRLILQKTSLV